jgi:glutamate N-acetyltransferase / amino-acid N-acetyltransferase
MPPPPSPLAPDRFPEAPAIGGFALATASAGLRYKGRADLLLVSFVEGAAAAGVLTRSRTASAPVDWCRRVLEHGHPRAILANAGNANAFTGRLGHESAEACARAAAREIGCLPEQIFLASTGVIGEPLDPKPIVDCLRSLVAALQPGGWDAAAQAIRTTDTFPKGSFRRTQVGGVPVQMGGIAKGSGMVAPDMATIFGFVFTDANLPGSVLQRMLSDEIPGTFNSITVDSDTSTSDTVLLIASRQAPMQAVTDAASPHLTDFRDALRATLTDLALQIVRDGEGATKLVTIRVVNAESDTSAKRIAFAVANSPLVKTAIAGQDPNWGRVVMAVGKAGEPADRDRLSIRFGDLPVAEAGQRAPAYSEAAAKDYMKRSELTITIDVGCSGRGTARVWTCDLTHGYVSINADYRS